MSYSKFLPLGGHFCWFTFHCPPPGTGVTCHNVWLYPTLFTPPVLRELAHSCSAIRSSPERRHPVVALEDEHLSVS